MATLRWRIGLLLIWLAIFFNIERLDINGRDTINLQSGVYVIGAVAALIAILPFFQQQPLALSLTLTSALYVSALLASPGPDFGDIQTYLTLTGFFMVMVTTILAYRVGQSLEEFHQAVEVVTFSGQGGRLRKINEAQEMVQVEMSSSRRTQRPLSLVLLQADASDMDTLMHRLVQEVQRAMLQRYVLGTVARVLSRGLRRTDLIIEDHRPGRLVLVAPETSRDGADAMGQRLLRLVHDRLGISANYGIATFPDQALTFEELLNVAEQQMHTQLPEHEDVTDPEVEIINLVEPHEQLSAPGQTKTVGM